MNFLYTILITFTLYCKYGQSLPQTISLGYKPNRPFYATGWTNYPSQIHPPGTPWPASAAGYTTTTTQRPWWATSTEAVEANAVSISSEVPTAPSTTTTTTTTPAPPPRTTTTRRSPPPTTTTRRTTTSRITTPRQTSPSTPVSQTTLANRIDVSTIATKVPPVQASTEGMLFTSAPEPAGGSNGPQGPPKQGSWSRPSSSVSPNLPPRMASENTPTLVQSNPDPLPNNLTLIPLNVPSSSSSSTTTTSAATSSEATSVSTPATPVTPSTVNSPRKPESALNLNSRFSSPRSVMGEFQEAPEQAWVWEFHEGDGKTSSGELYDVSAISFDLK